jgi:hypothetical protein
MICLNFWPAEALIVKYLAELTLEVLVANVLLKFELETCDVAAFVVTWSLVTDVLRAVIVFFSFCLLADSDDSCEDEEEETTDGVESIAVAKTLSS